MASKNLLIKSEQDLLNAFRPRDQRKVELPKGFVFPVTFEYYLTWAEPTGNRRYIIFQRPKSSEFIGMIFESDNQGSAYSVAGLCDWCHSYGPSDQISLLIVKPTSRIVVGKYLCRDLGCIEKLVLAKKFSKRSFDVHAEELLERIMRFYTAVFEEEAYESGPVLSVITGGGA